MRRPGLVSCGTRVHTIPVASATSIAATRATISSASSTSACSPISATATAFPLLSDSERRGVPRSSV